jgi:hypothetical protein
MLFELCDVFDRKLNELGAVCELCDAFEWTLSELGAVVLS